MFVCLFVLLRNVVKQLHKIIFLHNRVQLIRPETIVTGTIPGSQFRSVPLLSPAQINLVQSARAGGSVSLLQFGSINTTPRHARVVAVQLTRQTPSTSLH